jgi:cytochrome c biogenesis protein CcmG, thiol:disulfide interchange protein DsbE
MTRALVSITVCLILLLAGCDRGTAPKNIGRLAPEFSLQDGQGKISLRQFRGQVVVLNFWASWCPPCIDETPSLVTMQQRLKAKGITVVGVSSDEDEQAYRRFVQEYGINFPTVRDPSEKVEHLYGTVKIPETYIIDRNGVLRRKFVSEVNWNSPEVLSYLSTM